MKEVNQNVQYCLTNLQRLNEKIDTTNDYLDSIDANVKDIRNAIIVTNDKIDKTNEKLDTIDTSIKNDNVNTGDFQFATNDTQDPTTDGFNTLFTAVYNAFCSTSSKPLTVTLPYINQTFTIQPNLVSNAMEKSGLGFIVSLIQSFYFYCVCLFIYKDINKIVEHIKSGNLTADCGNVKTEVL